jgi:23S rRNA (guanosine2251-2'-O)-methyltransferase
MSKTRHSRRKRKPGSSPETGRNAARQQQSWLWGTHSVGAAIGNPARQFKQLYATSNAAHHIKDAAAGRQLQLEILPVEKLDRLLPPGAVHQGIAALVDPLPDLNLEDIEPGRDFVILDQVTDPHNVGAVLRTACAFGVAAMIVTNRNAPYPTGVLAKAASGAVEHVPILRVTNLSRTIDTLNDTGYQTIGLADGAKFTLQQVRDQSPSPRPLALVLGAEGKGIRDLTAKTCTDLARLDLPGPIKALNVSNAAAVAFSIVARDS